LVGAVVGGFTVGIMSVLLQILLPIEIRPFRDAFVFTAVILILLFRPEGLLRVKTSIERV
jgi:branched-chain amino acid transport system permease protein